MNNKYLEKIADVTKSEDSPKYVPTALGLGAAYYSAPKALGYHKLYHGTSEATAKKILEEGFDPEKGGSGAAKGAEHFERQSSGKTHFTKNPLVSRFFAAFTENGVPVTDPRSQSRAQKDMLKLKGRVLTARVPHSYWEEMKPDPDMGNVKDVAATFDKKVEKRYVSRAGGVGGVLPHLAPSSIAKHIRSNPLTALKGLAGASAGLGLAGYGMAPLFKSDK